MKCPSHTEPVLANFRIITDRACTNMIRFAYLAWLRHRLHRFLSDTSRARDIQHRALLRKLARNANSDFGRAYGFDSIRTAAEFRRRVPVLTYEDHHPHLSRVLNGQTTALFAPGTRVLMFTMTSGTTSEPKRLPITEELFREYQRGWRLWGGGAYGDHLDQLRKKTLTLASDWKQFHSPSGIPCGQISGLAATTRPRIAAKMFLPPSATTQIHDCAARHYTTLRIALTSSRIGMIATANPSTLIEFARRANHHSESLIRDIYDGTLSCEVPSSVRTALGPWLNRRNQRRARELEQLASRHGVLLPKHAWPDLSLLAVWTGGSVGIFLPKLPELYGSVKVRDHGLSASEGRMTIPLSDGSSAGLLDFYHSYFEFIPVEEHGKPSPTVLEAHELTPGSDYYILLTTSGGLYRYDIRDVVRCEGFRGQAPILEFLNKGKHFSSLVGEKLSEYQVILAAKNAFIELGLPISFFMIAPVMEAQPRYVLLLEARYHASRQADLAARVQANLELFNEEYAAKCASGRLLPLEVREVPAGTWRKLRDEKSHARGNVEEYKHIFLVEDLKAVERLTTRTHKQAQDLNAVPFDTDAVGSFPVAQHSLPGLDRSLTP